jgi:hypothetical protein
LQKHYVDPESHSTNLINATAEEKLNKNDAVQENDADQEIQADQPNISAIKEELCSSLLSIASKLLSSEHLRLHHLSSTEPRLWNSGIKV